MRFSRGSLPRYPAHKSVTGDYFPMTEHTPSGSIPVLQQFTHITLPALNPYVTVYALLMDAHIPVKS